VTNDELFKGGWGGVSTLKRFLNVLRVSLFWRHIKHDFKGNCWHHSLEDLQMPLGVNSAAKASDNWGAHVGEGADDAPGMEAF